MQRPLRSLDGKPISASVNGFTEYATERREAPVASPTVITPADLRLQLKELKRLFASDAIDRAINLLFQHMSAENPHRTDLSDFTTDIVELLYKAYKENGGEGSREYYLQCLFRPLRVATLSEMLDPTKDDLLVSVRGLTKFLQEHEKDPQAHQELIENYLPGQVVSAEPTYSIYSAYGVAYNIVNFADDIDQENYDVETLTQYPYSFTGADGYVHYCMHVQDLPIDYKNGIPGIPCFGTRTNTIKESTNFAGTCRRSGIDCLINADEAPDGTLTATAICTGDDISDTRHSLFVPNVSITANTTKTFSLYAKAESCRYMAFVWKDLEASDVKVQAIFDLRQGAHLCINPMTRYRCDMRRLSAGYYRCEFSMTHLLGRVGDLEIVFFKEKDSDPYYDFTGRSEICAQVWGMQLEEGPNASPYIPTHGKIGFRKPLSIIVPLESDWWDYRQMTLALAVTTPRQERSTPRPLFAFGNVENQLCVCQYTDALDIVTDTTLNYRLALPSDRYTQVTYTQNRIEAALSVGSKTKILDTPVDLLRAEYLYLGCDMHGNFLEGYIHHSTLYNAYINAAQATFLNGEDLHG